MNGGARRASRSLTGSGRGGYRGDDGNYSMRVHLRLFRQGNLTLGATHFDVQITGTAEHEVISWEFPEQFVMMDLIRSEKLALPPWTVPLADTGGYFRTINPFVYNGLPPWLRAIMGLTDPRVPMDGIARVFALDVPFDPVQDQRHEEWTIVYNQFVPKPFCSAGSWDWVRIQGPLQFVLDVHTNPSGYYSRTSTVAGVLSVTPFDTRTGALGSPLQAIISIDKRGMLTDQYSETDQVALQNLLGQPLQSKAWSLNAGHSDRYILKVDCGSTNP